MTDVTDRTVHRLDAAGQVRDWLVSPVWSWPCADLADVLAADGSPWGADGRWVLTNGPDVAPLKARLYARRPIVTDQALPEVVEGGPVSWARPDGRVDEGRWRRLHTAGDGLVDLSQFCHTPQYRQALAAAVLEVDQPEVRVLHVASTGPFVVFAGGLPVLTADGFSYMDPVDHAVPLTLPSGATEILIATWQVAFREVRHVLRMRLEGLPVRVVIPSPGADEYAAATAEQVLESVSLQQWASADGVARLHGPRGAAVAVAVGAAAPVPLRLDPAGVPVDLKAADAGEVPGAEAIASMLTTGETVLTVRMDDERCPVHRELRVAVLPERRRDSPVADPARWRDELLGHVAQTAPSVARLLARHALGMAADATCELAPALAMIDSRADCADFEAVGLMHVWHRIPQLRDQIRPALLGFKYWIDQPGLDAMCYFTENHQFVWHTAELLVGEALPGETFTNTGWTGARHADHGRGLAMQWLRRKLTGGFSEFDSNAYLAIDSLALVALVEFARDVEVRRHAEALLDKILLTLAANSWRGVHGAAHGRSYTPTLRSSRFEETAPIMWLLWGTGALNAAVLPATALATAAHYAVPPLVRAIAHDPPQEWYGRQVYRGTYRFEHDLLTRPYGSDLRVWRTPDAMLASVQDYRSGLPGLQEHVWGATLGSEVQVFATCPAASATGSSARPNAWAGQRVLPRARQHRDAVLVLHPAGPTHLWFPQCWMDETLARGPWLAGRVGEGYVAVATDGGFAPVEAGDEAYQAWLPVRPDGDGPAFVATVGRRAVDGDFADFVDALADPVVEAGRVLWANRAGDELALTLDGPFTVNGVPVDLDAQGRPERPPHLANPACTAAFGDPLLTAEWSGERLVLDLAEGRRIEPASGVDHGR